MTMSIEREATATLGVELPSKALYSEDDIVFPRINQRQLAWKDVVDGLQKWRIWVMLAYQDIKLRYRRSVLGPFWITLSMAITVYSMGFLYSHLFKVPFEKYFPFLVAGMLAWSLISTIVTELTEGLVASDSLIKQIKMPYTLYIHRIAARNMLIFFHNIIVIVPVLVLCHEVTKVNLNDLLLIPGLLIIYINAISYGLVLAMIGARFRDVTQIIKSLVQVIFFITPVMWAPDVLGVERQYFVDYNPFYAFIELVRAPLLGSAPTLYNLLVVSIVTGIGFLLCYKIFTPYRSRIVYWL